jgi:nicotinate-nucleotide adenylyltransferase
MRLGLFGGTFDPVHFGHLLLAECAREQCRLDEVRFLPAAVPPHKQQRELTPGAARAEMLELAIAGHERFSVSRHEIDRGGVSYTVETLAHFHQAHFHQKDPDGRLFFLLGADMLLDLPRWREPERVCRLAVPIAVRRPGAARLDFGCLEGIVSPERIETIRRHQVEMPRIDLASSEIRRRVAAGLSIRYRTPRAVEKYIETHGLYRS